MALQSITLSGNARLDQASVGPPPVKPLPVKEEADAVRRIQNALIALGFPLPNSIPLGARVPDGVFGDETKNAVIAFQKSVFPSSPDEWDGRVGPKTLAEMDARLLVKEKVIKDAFDASRASLKVVQARLLQLDGLITTVQGSAGFTQAFLKTILNIRFARDIAVIADKLRVTRDPLAADFRSALANVRNLIAQNLAQTSTIIDQEQLGRCNPNQFRPPGVPFAATDRVNPDPRVSVCTPFFAQNDDMKRDVLTHEFFHLVGLADMQAITSTADALNDANTVAQVIAYIHDRARTEDSSGLDRPAAPYPTP